MDNTKYILINPITQETYDFLQKELNKSTMDDLTTMFKELMAYIGENRIQYTRDFCKTDYKPTFDLNKLTINMKLLKADMIVLIASIMGDEGNVKQYVNSLSKATKELFTGIALEDRFWVSEDIKLDGKILFYKEKNSSYYYRETLKCLIPWLHIESTGYYHYDYDNMQVALSFNILFAYNLKKCSTDIPEQPVGIKDLPKGLKTYNGEENFIHAFPILEMLDRQEIIEIDDRFKSKVGTQKSIKAKTGLYDFLEEQKVDGIPANTLSEFLGFYKCLSQKEALGDVKNMAFNIIDVLCRMKPFATTILFMPHLGNVRDSFFWHRDYMYRDFLARFFYIVKASKDWINFDDIVKSMAIHKNHMTYDVNIAKYDAFEESYFTLKSKNTSIDPSSNGIKYITLPFLKTICATLAMFGILEVAFEGKGDSKLISPFNALTHIKLTNLGHYALKNTNTYEVQSQAKDTQLFELDTERLIVRNLVENNPYSELLTDIASYGGSQRYVLSCESFLKTCANEKDVDNKIELFKQFVCANPPQIWTDFFEDIKRHTNPLKEPSSDFHIYQLDPNNKKLIQLICTDPELKKYSTRAENFMILVDNKNMKKFTDRLKVLGYLI